MTITLKRQTFGSFSLVRIGDERNYIAFVPERNAYVHQVCLNGNKLLLNYADGEALMRNRGHRNVALFPFANRLGTGKYSWDGQQFAFPINDPATQSALHGIDRCVPFDLAAVTLAGTKAQVHMRYLHTPNEDPKAYPFLVLFEVKLYLDSVLSIAQWSMSARNLGSVDAPVGLGWHPYFKTAGVIEGWSVEMPVNHRVELQYGLPTGKLLDGLSPKPVALDPSWDNCYKLTEGEERRVILRGPDYGVICELGDDTPYCQLFVPPTADALAIEPVTCGVDAFRQNPSEVRVAPGATVSTSLAMRLV